MELRLSINQTPTFNNQGEEIYYYGTSAHDLKIEKVKKIAFPPNRQFPNHPEPYDITDHVSDLFKLKLSWSIEKSKTGVSVPGASEIQKGISGTITFEGEAYHLLKKWLIDDVSAPLNSVDVRITHVKCGTYLDYTIKATDLRWCEDSMCTFDVTLKKKDEQLNCLKRTMISHNEYGWFQTQPVGKQHPRFSYCNERRPNGMLVVIWWLMGAMIVPVLLTLIPIMAVFNVIIFVVNSVIKVVNWLKKIIFGSRIPTTVNEIEYFDFKKIKESLATFFIEAGGCGREHPAPLIRDYIWNVCKKCRIDVDAESVPIFFAEHMNVKTSGRGTIKVRNPHYNACYLSADVSPGIRRVKTLNAFRSHPNNTDYYIEANRPLMTLDEFLDKLKPVYNAEWRVTDGKLYFERKDSFLDGKEVYNFTDNHPNTDKLLEGICYEWNELRQPAYTKGLYTDDALDSSGNTARYYMDDIISHGNIDENPTFEGWNDKSVQFGATRFRLDGTDEDYLYDAMQVVVNGSFLTPFFAGLMFDVVGPHIEEFCDYGLLLQDETCTLPKILLWDGNSYDNARCIRTHTSTVDHGSITPPHPNTKYNSGSVSWSDSHIVYNKVRGSNLTLPKSHAGYYTITDFFGARKIKKPVMLVNYPMYFAAGYLDSMWDWFHWIDDPKENPVLNMNWSAKIELCCDDLKHLKLFESLTKVKLGQKILLPVKNYPEGKITEIEVSYDPTDKIGKYIALKGTV